MNKDLLKEVLYYEQLSLTLIILVLIVAFILGAIHALGPGHGKSLMAAYLIGSRGRISDAITLTFSLTIAHVFSVFVVGLLALFLADFFLPETISKWFGLFSGIAIFFIGLWLFISRYKAQMFTTGNEKHSQN
ncbi:high frequency lysogenization protein HflD, partial [bacterium]|nr:high frequency lysogenization protein HflD [bacterium]